MDWTNIVLYILLGAMFLKIVVYDLPIHLGPESWPDYLKKAFISFVVIGAIVLVAFIPGEYALYVIVILAAVWSLWAYLK